MDSKGEVLLSSDDANDMVKMNIVASQGLEIFLFTFLHLSDFAHPRFIIILLCNSPLQG